MLGNASHPHSRSSGAAGSEATTAPCSNQSVAGSQV